MKTPSPKKGIAPIYLPNEMHRRVSTLAKHKGVKIGEYVVSKISTSVTKDESAMREEISHAHAASAKAS